MPLFANHCYCEHHRLDGVHNRIQGRAWTHDSRRFGLIKTEVATRVGRIALAVNQFFQNRLLILLQFISHFLKMGREFRVVRLLGQRFRPEQRNVVVGAAVVNLLHLARWRLVLEQVLRRGLVQSFAQDGRCRVSVRGSCKLVRRCQRQEFTQRVPSKVVLLLQLLNVLWRRTTRSRFKQRPAVHERDNRQHFGRRAEFENGKQVSEVIPQHVACDRDGVFTLLESSQRVRCRIRHVHDFDRESIGIMVFEVLFHLANELRVVWAFHIEPKDGRRARGASTAHGQTHPVFDGGVLGLAHAPNVPWCDVMCRKNVVATLGHHLDHAFTHVVGNLKRLVVRAVLFSLLCHQPDVGDRTHGRGVKRAVLNVKVNRGLVQRRVRRVWNDRLGVFELTVLVPHLARVPDHGWHGCINDNVRRNVQVGDAAVRIHHGEFRSVVKGRLNVFEDEFDGRFVVVGVRNRVEHGRNAVVGVDANFVQGLRVFDKNVLEVRAYGSAENDGVRDLHHGCLHVERQQQIVLLGILQLLFQKAIQRRQVHHHGVNHLTRQHGEFLQHRRLPIRRHVLNRQ
eukprot:m.177508 g.177508  ORF g.177508 m.177508 type:complete len:566 (+) comp14363_c0_seq1:88-1785(+)